MARLGRYYIAGQPLHVIQRGNNRKAIFFAEEDYTHYTGWLSEAAQTHGCAVHAYVLMTNHVHLLVTRGRADSLPRTMQSLGRCYVRHINAAYRRSGTLWEGRYRAAAIEGDAYFFSCCRYIELNPVRAGMVRHPRDYRWSSYRALIREKLAPEFIEALRTRDQRRMGAGVASAFAWRSRRRRSGVSRRCREGDRRKRVETMTGSLFYSDPNSSFFCAS